MSPRRPIGKKMVVGVGVVPQQKRNRCTLRRVVVKVGRVVAVVKVVEGERRKGWRVGTN